MDRSLCTEEFTLKSNLTPNVESASTVSGNGALDSIADDGLKLGVIWHTVLLAHEPIAAPEWFTIVSTALLKVRFRLAYVSGATFARLRNAVFVCKCPNSTSTGVVTTGTADLVISEGRKLPPVIEASKNNTATPLGGVSPMVRLMGTPLTVGEVFIIEPLPQAARKAQLTSTSATMAFLHIVDPPAITVFARTFWAGTRGLGNFAD
jgi:hypothetical protein